MGVYIKGMEMPKQGMVVNIYADGRVANHFDEFRKTIGKAAPVPPHGRLIDADAIRADIDEKRPGRSYEDAWALTVLDNAPTIIPAEEGET